MSYLREDIERTNLDIPEGEIEIVSAANPVYANALEVHEKKKEEAEKVMAEKKEEVKDGVLGIKGKTTAYPKTKDLKKMKLSERLFEDSDWKTADKEAEKDLWTSIYNELNGDIKRLDAKTRRFVKKPSERYSEKDLATSGEVITVYADDSERLDFAKEVAEEYGVEYKVTEHTSRYAPAKFSMKIYTSNPATYESLDNVKTFGRKAKSKDLKESSNSAVYTDVAKYFDYGAPSDFLEVMADLVDRAMMNKDEGYDSEEAVHDAIDSGLIYHKDIWTVKSNYEDSLLADETYERLFHDLYSIVSGLTDNDVEESIDKTEEIKEATATINNVQNHQGSFASIIEQNISEIDSLINKGDREALLDRLQELVDEAELTGKNLERANSYMRGLRAKRDFSSLAVSLYNIKLAAMNKENKVINTNKKNYEGLTEDVTITEESDLTDFKFWSGARDTVAVMTTEDIRTISNYLGEIYPEGMTPTQINDFFWFENETIAEWLGYDSFEDYERRELDEDVRVSKNGFGSKLKSSISKFFQGKQDFEKALDDGEGVKGAIETAKKKSSERDEEKRLEQQKLSNKRDNRLPTFILKELISWRDDNGSHMGKGPQRLTKHIEDIRKQGKEHPTIVSAAKKMRISASEYYDMWNQAADTALKFKKTPTAKIKISYK